MQSFILSFIYSNIAELCIVRILPLLLFKIKKESGDFGSPYINTAPCFLYFSPFSYGACVSLCLVSFVER